MKNAEVTEVRNWFLYNLTTILGRGGFDSNRGRGGAHKATRDVVIPSDRNLKLISNMYKVDSKLDEVYR